jgi:hypothetical protein
MAVAMPVAAQTTRERGWVDVNFGYATPAESTLTTTWTSIPDSGGESTTAEVTYHSPSGAMFDFGGGVMFSAMLGAGVSFVGTSTEDNADLYVNVPHPLYYNAYASDTSETEDKLERQERAFNISFMFKLPITNDKVRVRLFGGPTYYKLKGDAVTDIQYNQVFAIYTPANAVAIDAYDSKEVEASGWGYHVGGDIAFMFSKYAGVGGFARYLGGTVTVDDEEVLADEPVDVKVGGFQVGGGLRLRF